MPDNYQMLFCTCPNKTSARAIASLLVENNLAACVNIIPSIESVYQWEGKIETAQEELLIIKSRLDKYDEIEQQILDHHPYELPEIIAVTIDAGLSAYLSWIDKNVSRNK